MDTLAQLRAGQLAGLKRLDLSCGLTEFPREIFDLADSLEVLNLSGNALSSLPDDLHRLTRLRVLFCSDNHFTQMPACVGQCAQLSMIGFKANRIERVPAAALPPLLRWLILTDNRIEELPDELGQRPHLQKLMLSGNRLTRLPQSLGQCHQLELIRIAANHLSELPAFLLGLPRLTWLAYAGNPLESEADAAALESVAQIPWAELELQQRLGEGASGVIHQARWQRPGQAPSEVAVKLYKGSMTSDGSPLHEMNACISAGRHPNLIRVEGRISDHPQGQNGLVMQLIEPSYRNLAALPSLASCTRDIYDENIRFSADAALRMARGIASVGAHLHRQGITHGDLYGHNILWNPQGECLLGDFGAASFHALADTEETRGLQRIEVRAFGILLEELLERIESGLSPRQRERLQALVSDCCQPQVLARPGFAEVGDVLRGI
ncbi:leucine-rich repeat-containing protein kinase family protein [Pseudomonas chlororaphis]|uniref:leucine-rich repeat-containing protein kinase family protein n=1 Tax=Pseudomonas chlororaphis TaxID=587753 RepID=UPI0006A60C7C|nr:leucine-rich repeat-containing protein kinase family protein [Pseudomonas chlororaphis]AZC32136.1 Serine/threonine protein kinase [Pseudomonas chlororaphis subsp. piscium]WDG77193.1 leucine-rich repeat-containing protein kinase family protein [Pseudomonas chlororaphis]WDG83568.1 leucine-rich repeat-containing protein kinase family protein [Pseudomonas chlororaphis]WDG89870.1 leucine-rich repeat-containing protein kinase family protein [Pseudomonas chlororaphis]SDS72931.1 Leucine rich repeat